MKKIGLIIFTCLVACMSCQRELFFPPAESSGTLKANISGDCLPSRVNGTYTKNIPVQPGNYIEVAVDVRETGTFDIISDTVNGLSFAVNGKFDSIGINKVILPAKGTPVEAGVTNFTIRYNTSFCKISIVIDSVALPPGGGGGGGGGTGVDADYTIGGSPNNCSNSILSGSYIADYTLDPLKNYVKIEVNVASPGNYTISTIPVNGIKFSATGVFSSLGMQNVYLKGNGTPLSAGTNTYTASGGGTACSFDVITKAHANFTFSGAPGNCLPVTVSGVYKVGNGLDNSNCVTFEVNVLATGSFIISTDTQDGFSYYASGAFTNTGLQSVIMNASFSDPIATGNYTFTPQPNASTCRFTVTVLP